MTAGQRALVGRFVAAWDQADVGSLLELLAEDAKFTMPPLASWFGGEESQSASSSRGWPLSGAWRWRPLTARANGQPALAFYIWDDGEGAYMPFALNVLTFRGDRISAVDAFVDTRDRHTRTASRTRAGPTSRSTPRACTRRSRASGSRSD